MHMYLSEQTQCTQNDNFPQSLLSEMENLKYHNEAKQWTEKDGTGAKNKISSSSSSSNTNSSTVVLIVKK